MASDGQTSAPRRRIRILACRTGADATTVVYEKGPMIESVSSHYTPPPVRRHQPPSPLRSSSPPMPPTPRKPLTTLLFSRRYGRDLITRVGKRPTTYYDFGKCKTETTSPSIRSTTTTTTTTTPNPSTDNGEAVATPSSPKRLKTGTFTRVDVRDYTAEHTQMINRVVSNLMNKGPPKCSHCGRMEFLPSKETGELACEHCGLLSKEYSDSALDYRPSSFTDRFAAPRPGDRTFSHSDATDRMIESLTRAQWMVAKGPDAKLEDKTNRVEIVMANASASPSETSRVLSVIEQTTANHGKASSPSAVAGYAIVANQHASSQSTSGETAQQVADRYGVPLRQAQKSQYRVLTMTRNALAANLGAAAAAAAASSSSSDSDVAKRSIETLESIAKSPLNAARSQIDSILGRCFPTAATSETLPLATAVEYVLDRMRDLDMLSSLKSQTKTLTVIWFASQYHPLRTTTFQWDWPRIERTFKLKKKTIQKHVASMIDARFMLLPLVDASAVQLRNDFLSLCNDKENVSEAVLSKCLHARKDFPIPFYASYLEVRNLLFR